MAVAMNALVGRGSFRPDHEATGARNGGAFVITRSLAGIASFRSVNPARVQLLRERWRDEHVSTLRRTCLFLPPRI